MWAQVNRVRAVFLAACIVFIVIVPSRNLPLTVKTQPIPTLPWAALIAAFVCTLLLTGNAFRRNSISLCWGAGLEVGDLRCARLG